MVSKQKPKTINNASFFAILLFSFDVQLEIYISFCKWQIL